MATISAYETKAGRRYRVRYRKPDKSQTDKRGFKTKKEAELFLASVTVAKATGDYIDPQLGRVTIGHLAADWLALKKGSLKPSSYRPLESSWNVWVKKRWAHREVASIQPSEVRLWVAEISDGKSGTTVARAVGVLAGILDMAVADRKIPRNPATGVTVRRKKQKRRVYLSHDQVHMLAAESLYPALVLTLAYTGLRWGEATALRVRDLNELHKRLHVVENAVLVGTEIHLGTAKTHEQRTVPYAPFIGKLLAKEIEGKGPEDLIFGDGKEHLKLPYSVDGWFASAVKRLQVKQEALIEEAVKLGEEPSVKPFPRVTPHDLRHTAASLAVSSGANVKAIQRMLGHASAAMTLDTYADLFDDDLDAVAVAMESAAREAAQGKPWQKTIVG